MVWVSNLVPVSKNHGNTYVCIDFSDLNLVFPKDKYPMLFIHYIIDECVGNEAFYFVDGFSSYNQIQIWVES